MGVIINLNLTPLTSKEVMVNIVALNVGLDIDTINRW